MVQDQKNPKQFAAFDIDGTLIRWQLYHAVTDKLAKLGYINQLDYERIHRARIAWKMRSHDLAYKEYEATMVEIFERIILKLDVTQFKKTVDDVIEQYKDQVYTYSHDLIKVLKAKKYTLFAISGSQVELVSQIAAYYGFDDYVGTNYVQKAGLFTGDKLFYANNKKKALDQLIAKHGVDMAGSIAVGDSSSDISMLEMVESPIAFNPEKGLLIHAKKLGWKIVVERKNVVYIMEQRNGSYVLA